MKWNFISLVVTIVLSACSQGEKVVMKEFDLLLASPTYLSKDWEKYASQNAREYLAPFQAKNECGAYAWYPKIAFLRVTQGAAESTSLPLDLPSFAQTAERAQNSIQRVMQQAPEFADLRDAAVANLKLLKLPPLLLEKEPTELDGEALRTYVASSGVKIAAFVVKTNTPPTTKPASTSGDMEKAVEMPVNDVESFRSAVHASLCARLAKRKDDSTMPRVVLAGLFGSVALAAPAASQLSADVKGSVPPKAEAPPPPALPSADAQRLFDRGFTFVQNSNFDAAISEFTKAIEAHPTYAAAYANRGGAHTRKKSMGRALDDLTKATELEPKNALWRYYLASYYSQKGEVDRGLDALDQALKLGFGLTDAAQRDALKFDQKGDADLANLRRKRAEYCDVLERNQRYLCKS